MRLKDLQLVLDFVQECSDTMTMLLVSSLGLVVLLMLVADKCVHRSGKSPYAFTHPRAFGGKDYPLHSGFPVAPSIIWTVCGMITDLCVSQFGDGNTVSESRYLHANNIVTNVHE